MKLVNKIVILWGAVTVALNSLIYSVGASYDSGGAYGLLWWGGLILSLPASLLSEGLRSFGIDMSGYLGHVAIVIFLCLLVVLGIKWAQQRKETS